MRITDAIGAAEGKEKNGDYTCPRFCNDPECCGVIGTGGASHDNWQSFLYIQPGVADDSNWHARPAALFINFIFENYILRNVRNAFDKNLVTSCRGRRFLMYLKLFRACHAFMQNFRIHRWYVSTYSVEKCERVILLIRGWLVIHTIYCKVYLILMFKAEESILSYLLLKG